MLYEVITGKDIHALRGEERMTFRREVQAVFQDPLAWGWGGLLTTCRVI